MRGPVKNATRHPTRGFVAYDPEGYFLEFETFLDDPQNMKLREQFKKTKAIHPDQNQKSGRPENLGIQGNVIWLYLNNWIPNKQDRKHRIAAYRKRGAFTETKTIVANALQFHP